MREKERKEYNVNRKEAKEKKTRRKTRKEGRKEGGKERGDCALSEAESFWYSD